MAEADDHHILSVEEGWRLYLDERFDDQMTTQEKREIARHYTQLKLTPPKLEANRELLRYRGRSLLSFSL